MKKGIALILIGTLFILVACIVFFPAMLFGKGDELTKDPKTDPGTKTPKEPAKGKDDFPLKRGSSGPRVTNLRNALTDVYGAKGIKAGSGDIEFGGATEQAVIAHISGSGEVNLEQYNKLMTAWNAKRKNTAAAAIKVGDKIYSNKEGLQVLELGMKDGKYVSGGVYKTFNKGTAIGEVMDFTPGNNAVVRQYDWLGQHTGRYLQAYIPHVKK